MTTDNSSSNRLFYLDNFRFFLVTCVILEHAGNAYRQMSWWPVSEEGSSIFVQWLGALSDAFAMPLFFYVAGYFALFTIRKKGAAAFIKGKFKRLGIPWLICILFVCPVVPLVYHYTRNDFAFDISYGSLWLKLMANTGDLNVGIIRSMDELMQNLQFYQRYMWFLSLLLLFFILFGLIYSVKKDWFQPVGKSIEKKSPSVLSTLKILMAVGGLTFVCSSSMVGSMMFLNPGLSDPEPLFNLASVIQFRPSRLSFFVIYFILGILAYKNNWVARGVLPGHLPTWVVSFGGILFGYLAARQAMLNGPEDLEEAFGLLFFFFLNFLTISSLGLFLSLALRFWNQTSAVWQRLSSNAYNMYLSHYVFVIGFQLLLLVVPGIPIPVKFAIVSVLSFICCWLASQYLIKPYPKLTILAVICMFVLMVSTIRV